MKYLIYLVFLSFSCFGLTTQPLAAVGEVNYISDVVTVPLRSGPTTAHRILHRGLPSGTQLTILAVDEEAGFTQVRTTDGMEGWITSQYLVGEPIARVKLAATEKRLQSLKAEIDKEREARASIQAEHKETDANNRTLNSQVQSLSKELTELKRISADSINEHARNIELTQQNTRLAGQVEELSSKARQLEENLQLKWLLYGGGLVLIGLLIGVILKSRPRQTTSYTRYT
ncbi:MAG TPA: TIGR04211 family SH3 domain-containing protein [Nitrospirales bacterium]|nr:TIGR04211 family SH3 domain-containing protein [Nitrospira sp. MA-1]HNP60384.1 TIGR04211 family SH3 domain-containing protein [Nitrospirales bacterium]